MKCLVFLCLMSFIANTLKAQNVYTIKADSVKITNCDSAELILENHSQEGGGTDPVCHTTGGNHKDAEG